MWGQITVNIQNETYSNLTSTTLLLGSVFCMFLLEEGSSSGFVNLMIQTDKWFERGVREASSSGEPFPQ